MSDGQTILRRQVNAYATSVDGLSVWNDGGTWTVTHDPTGAWVWLCKKKVHGMIAAEELGQIMDNVTSVDVTIKPNDGKWGERIRARCVLKDTEDVLARAKKKAEREVDRQKSSC